jgi:hypothetical protein
MNTDTKQQIEAALRAFSGADLRAASIGLLNSLGYQSEKTLDLDGSPETFFEQFDKRDRKFRKEAVDEWVRSGGADDHRQDDRGRAENR